MHPLEQALQLTVYWLAPALLGSVLLLVVPHQDNPFGLVMVHLAVMVAFGLVLTMRMVPLLADGDGWFDGSGWSPATRRLAAASALLALETGAVGLLTLASSAALRLEPSLQFLQLLSALDIAWAGGAIALGFHLLFGRRLVAWMGGLLVGLFCLYSLWRYLDIVGFTADGGWLVSGSDLLRYVIPFDMAAAVVAIVALWAGSHAGRFTEQASPQS